MVTGDEYPASPERMLAAQVAQFSFYAFIACVLFGESFCQSAGVETPQLVKSLGENKLLYSIGGVFLLA